jgi:hypothetical protein
MFPGQMEATVHEAYIKAGKLRQWLQKPSCLEVMKECKNLLDKATAPKVRSDEEWGAEALQEGKMSTIPKDLEGLLGRDKARLLPRFSAHDVQYSTTSAHLGNSLIFYYSKGDTKASPVPGSIKYIYYNENHVFFAVRRQLPRPADDTRPDPFANYPDFPAKLYQARFSDTLEEIEVDWTICHYARWDTPEDHSVVLMLVIVSVLYLFHVSLPTDYFSGLKQAIVFSLDSFMPHMYKYKFTSFLRLIPLMRSDIGSDAR